MGNRKEEERNEKIIRGLMKLPPNRKCINCNSLGPQYVCTNFWSFVCVTCSGIHREFTHRVKSVSMAKFTSQEVEALQNGGNQRAREIYLKDWDLQRQRLPDSSNIDKIRQFIKDVYVDRRFAGGKTSNKPPRDMQSHRSREDETRRASSYHSYSQSPPYDYQYEDWRYGKQGAMLTRKPGSDRGLYEGKMSSSAYSPGRLSEHTYEDRFANEVSISRVSDYSASSGGDPFRSGTQSPNYQKDIGFSSPPFQSSRNISHEDVRIQEIDTSSEANFNKGADRFPCQQRSRSSGSSGSIDSNFVPLKSFNSGGLTDTASEPEIVAGTFQEKFLPGSSDGLDLFKIPSAPETVTAVAASIDLFQLPVASSALSIDLFQLPIASSSSAQTVDLFHPSVVSSASSMVVKQPPTVSTSSLDFFADYAQPQSTATCAEKLQEVSEPKNGGWATFDTPHSSPSIPGTGNVNPTNVPSVDGGSVGKFDLFSSPASISGTGNNNPTNIPSVDCVSVAKFDPFSSIGTSTQWPSFQDSSFNAPSSSISSPWNMHDVTVPTATSAQLWNAFEDSARHQPLHGVKRGDEIHLEPDKLSSTADQYLGSRVSENSIADGIQQDSFLGELVGPVMPSPNLMGLSYTPPMLSLVEETQSHASKHKSNNPFDFTYNSDLEQNNMFLDMSSLQAALPNAQLSSSFLGDVSEPWFPQSSVAPYIPAAGQGRTSDGGLTYMAAQVPSSQIPNVSSQGSVASVGGNPFA
ncbi:probable ADP-ribosylation factor GTPase-activating protein AGD14 isoform X1 [Ziziphus jujuba]|uniref:Probable ADP-ribosylation factor GTPase-activating protein AGD14 isoform X1 n=1 Tax=Ziziphus jujuba TaxID=326968 RepID=A0A6P4BB96_ZIZJJ|nr:probable ADP-ribosylation factor GTPase-activating protein AGD14 isoform X1 [Ziziphus jujuba]